MTLYALILAGGLGSRLGHVRKADLRIGGVSLLERVSRSLPVEPENLFVATGTDTSAPKFGNGIADLTPHEGPMGGIRAFLHRASPSPESLVVTTSVDSPFLPNNYIEALIEAIKPGFPAVCAVWNGQIYPTNAIWRVGDLISVAHLSSPKRALEAVGATQKEWSGETENPFANINGFPDVLASQRRAEGLGKSQVIHSLCD